jgi:hypothetical protein
MASRIAASTCQCMVLALLPAFQLAGGARANDIVSLLLDTQVVLWLADDPELPWLILLRMEQGRSGCLPSP